MAMDYLPIQVSAIPCERVFSLSAETDTKRRNRLSPLTMEALQMLKFHLKKTRLDFTQGWMTSGQEMVNDIADDDLLGGLLNDSYHDVFDKAMKAIDEKEEDKPGKEGKPGEL